MTSQPPLPRLPQRPADSHKGHYGRALLVGGSRGMTGAIALAGLAALRGGAGLVRLAVPEQCLNVVAALEPSYMTVGLPGDHQGRITSAARDLLRPWIDAATCVAVGPGLGRSGELTDLVAELYRELKVPLVLDADALNALADLRETVLNNAGGARILTPHPGEFRRLLNDASLAAEQQIQAAAPWAKRYGVVLVLKGHRTLTTDGTRQVRNTTGNPGMATGGSGDVLTGVITALVCQGLAPFDAARLGVYVHGLAGDLAARAKGQTSLIARDLVDFLPQAFQQLETP